MSGRYSGGTELDNIFEPRNGRGSAQSTGHFVGGQDLGDRYLAYSGGAQTQTASNVNIYSGGSDLSQMFTVLGDTYNNIVTDFRLIGDDRNGDIYGGNIQGLVIMSNGAMRIWADRGPIDNLVAVTDNYPFDLNTTSNISYRITPISNYSSGQFVVNRNGSTGINEEFIIYRNPAENVDRMYGIIANTEKSTPIMDTNSPSPFNCKPLIASNGCFYNFRYGTSQYMYSEDTAINFLNGSGSCVKRSAGSLTGKITGVCATNSYILILSENGVFRTPIPSSGYFNTPSKVLTPSGATTYRNSCAIASNSSGDVVVCDTSNNWYRSSDHGATWESFSTGLDISYLEHAYRQFYMDDTGLIFNYQSLSTGYSSAATSNIHSGIFETFNRVGSSSSIYCGRNGVFYNVGSSDGDVFESYV